MGSESFAGVGSVLYLGIVTEMFALKIFIKL